MADNKKSDDGAKKGTGTSKPKQQTQDDGSSGRGETFSNINDDSLSRGQDFSNINDT